MKKEYYIKRIDKNDYISFDVFDTLIGRSVEVPAAIFDLVGKKTHNENFRKKRIAAEDHARENSISGEVCIDDIYKYMSESAEEYKQIELDTETECVVPIHMMDDMLRYAVEQKKRVFLISDMYLPEEQINKMLKKCDLPLEKVKLYISCEVGVNKVSGKLFEYVIRENSIEKGKMIHFGDSLKADILGAWKAGIHSGIVSRKNRLKRKLM